MARLDERMAGRMVPLYDTVVTTKSLVSSSGESVYLDGVKTIIKNHSMVIVLGRPGNRSETNAGIAYVMVMGTKLEMGWMWESCLHPL